MFFLGNLLDLRKNGFAFLLSWQEIKKKKHLLYSRKFISALLKQNEVFRGSFKHVEFPNMLYLKLSLYKNGSLNS